MGTWYQVLWLPNRFQKQCVSDTTATYRDLGSFQLLLSLQDDDALRLFLGREA